MGTNLEYKHKSVFSNTIRTFVPEEVDQYLSKASLAGIKNLIPASINYNDNIDLIPHVGRACNVNRANKNYDAIETETALKIYKNFIWKPGNSEHDKTKVMSVVVDAGFATFEDQQHLSIDEVKDMKEPFDIVLALVAWRIVNDKFSHLLIQSSDEASEHYNSIGLSWELLWNDYVIGLGDRNIIDAEVVEDPKKVQELSKYLKQNGGPGRLPDGTIAYRILRGDPLPVGIGYTLNPAGDTLGIHVDNGIDDGEEENAAASTPDENSGVKEDGEAEQVINIRTKSVSEWDKAYEEQCEENESLIQSITIKHGATQEEIESVSDKALIVASEADPENQTTLNTNEQSKDEQEKSNEKKTTYMKPKIKTLKDIEAKWDEIRESETSADVIDFLKTEIEKGVASAEEEMKTAAEAKAKKEKEYEEMQASLKETSEQLAETQKALKAMEEQQAAQAAEIAFNHRMETLDEKFNLDKDDRKVIANQIKDLDDEAFASWLEQFSVLSRSKAKKDSDEDEDEDEGDEGKSKKEKFKERFKGKKGKKDDKKDEKKSSKASVEDEDEEDEIDDEEVLSKATQVDADIGDKTETTPQSLYEQYRDAFQIERIK